MTDLTTELCGLPLDNPIIPASGTFGYAREASGFYDLNELGSLCLKGTTAEPRFGNPLPRIAEAPAGMLNAVGLQNPGIDAVVSCELPALAEIFQKPVIANISGFSVEEYASVGEKLNREPQVGWIEVNISCPNVHGGGMSFGTDPVAAAEVTRAVKAVTTKPVILKLSPNVTDITEIALACEEAGADGLCLINTLLAMRIDLKTRSPLLANRTGGLSGPCLLPLALRMVWQVSQAVRIPVVGVGGISSARDVLEMMMAGACCVEIGAANIRDPLACHRILRELPEEMEHLEISSLKSIIGAAHEN